MVKYPDEREYRYKPPDPTLSQKALHHRLDFPPDEDKLWPCDFFAYRNMYYRDPGTKKYDLSRFNLQKNA